MKTILMHHSFEYRPRQSVIVVYSAGQTYDRVPEAAVRAILGARAGEVTVRPQTKEPSE